MIKAFKSLMPSIHNHIINIYTLTVKLQKLFNRNVIIFHNVTQVHCLGSNYLISRFVSVYVREGSEKFRFRLFLKKNIVCFRGLWICAFFIFFIKKVHFCANAGRNFCFQDNPPNTETKQLLPQFCSKKFRVIE